MSKNKLSEFALYGDLQSERRDSNMEQSTAPCIQGRQTPCNGSIYVCRIYQSFTMCPSRFGNGCKVCGVAQIRSKLIGALGLALWVHAQG
jgi:hypothetical protein